MTPLLCHCGRRFVAWRVLFRDGGELLVCGACAWQAPIGGRFLDGRRVERVEAAA